MRLFHYLRAKLSGYFWIPCPVCGENFGGHEITAGKCEAMPISGDWHHGKLVCPKAACQSTAKQATHEARCREAVRIFKEIKNDTKI